MISRRGLLLGGATLAAGGAFSLALRRYRLRSFDFRPLPAPAGFREVPRAKVSTAADVFFGIGEAPPPVPAFAGDPCPALFPNRVPGVVPVAAFTDVNCPFCKRLAPILGDLSADGRIALSWHELPLLGPTSLPAARAALAADMQGAGTAFRLRLMRSRFVATPAYLERLAASLDLDAARLLADAESSAVTRSLATSRALSRLFAVPGTPALVVGRTLVVGALERARLEALISIEKETPGMPCE